MSALRNSRPPHTGNRTAIEFMLLSVIGSSTLPISIVAIGGKESPFLFGGSQAIGHVIGGLIFLYGRYGLSTKNRRIRYAIVANLRSSAIIFSALGPFTFAFLAWSTVYIDATVATILWGSWPILIVIFLSKSSTADGMSAVEDTYTMARRPLSVSLIFMMLLALTGLGFVVVSQSSNDGTAIILDLTSRLSLIGIFIALGSSWLASLTTWHFRWADSLLGQLDRDTLAQFAVGRSILQAPMQAASLFFVTVCLIIGNMIAMPVLLFIGFVMNEPIKASVILGGLAIGLMIRTPAAILWRVSNLVTKTYGVNAINYLEPLFGLLWLTVLWERQVANFNYLIIGVCTIVAANLLINSRT